MEDVVEITPVVPGWPAADRQFCRGMLPLAPMPWAEIIHRTTLVGSSCTFNDQK